MPIPPRSVFAAVTRQAVENHDDWDSPHTYQTLHWDGEKVTTGTYAVILTDVHPADYAEHMARIAREEMSRRDPAYAHLLLGEFHGLPSLPPGATEAERRQRHADRVNRTYHLNPDAVEAAVAWCADIHGRLWCATKTRAAPEVIHETFYPPGQGPGGHLIRGLIAVARLTGTGYGLSVN